MIIIPIPKSLIIVVRLSAKGKRYKISYQIIKIRQQLDKNGYQKASIFRKRKKPTFIDG